MASILKVDEMQGVTSAGDITITSEGGSATQSLQQGVAKAWGNVDGDTGPTLRDSLNVASLTDVGTGRYDFNFSNSFRAAEQAGGGLARRSGVSRGCIVGLDSQGNELGTGVVGWSVANDAGVLEDQHNAALMLVGDLA